MEDWNEGDEQARLLSMLREAWIKRVTNEEAKRAKSNHTVKMMLPNEYHTNVVAWTRKNVTRDVKRHSLRNSPLITVTGDREKTAMWRLDECELGGQTIRLQAIPARMSCDEVLEWVGEELLKEYRNLHHPRRLRPRDRDVNYVGEGSWEKLPWTQQEPMAMRLTMTMSPPRQPFVPSLPTTCTRGATGEAGSPCRRVERRRRRRSPAALATLRCPLGSSYELTPRAVLCVMGGTRGSTMTTGHASSTRPTQGLRRGCTGRRSVRPRVSGKPRWRSPGTSYPS